MRTLPVLLPVLLGADRGVPGSGGRPAAPADARGAFTRALDTGLARER